MNYLYMLGVLAIVAYLQVGYCVSGKMYDLYYAREKTTWWKLFLIWPVATISHRRNLKNNDWKFEKAPYEDCYAYLLPNRSTREYYLSVMTFFWGIKVMWNLIVFTVVGFLLMAMPIGVGLALGIALPLKSLIGRE
jgi:hypothetical protein